MEARSLQKSETGKNVLFSGTRLSTLSVTFRKSISQNKGRTAKSTVNIKITSSKPHCVELAGSEAVLALVL